MRVSIITALLIAMTAVAGCLAEVPSPGARHGRDAERAWGLPLSPGVRHDRIESRRTAVFTNGRDALRRGD